jgi:hypothetical protein
MPSVCRQLNAESRLYVQYTWAAPRRFAAQRDLVRALSAYIPGQPSVARFDVIVQLTVLFEMTCHLTRSFPGLAMHNLADTYNQLGQHKDALVLQEKTLELRRRALPANHPDIGST